MRPTLVLALAAAFVAACSQVSPEQKVIEAAAAALGGRDRIQAAKTLVIEGAGPAPLMGQNRMPDDEMPIWQVTMHRRAIDLANRRTQVRQRREARFPFAGATLQETTQGLDGDVAYNVATDGATTRASDAAGRDRRIELLHHPLTIVRAALAPGARIANARQEADSQVVDITTAQGDNLTLTVDGTTGLPLRVRSMADHPNLGDVEVVTAFSEYEPAAGLQLPKRLTTKVDKYVQFDLTVSANAVDTAAGDLAAPETVSRASAPTAPAVVVTAEPVAKGIWWLAGSGNHRSVLFEFADHLVLFEVPLNEARSKAVIDKARTLSSKPLTHAIVSHHHFDHSGGLRVVVAEGLTIITQRGNEAFFNDLLARRHTIVPDALERRPRMATFELVDDHVTLQDASMQLQLFHLLDNPREGTNLFAYVPRDRILVQADLYDSTWLQHPWGDNVLHNLAQRKLKVEKDVPVHGAIEPFDQMVKTIKAKPAISALAADPWLVSVPRA